MVPYLLQVHLRVKILLLWLLSDLCIFKIKYRLKSVLSLSLSSLFAEKRENNIFISCF